ncbi:putative histone-binding protein [Gregarina niphandrodes]|uniref:Histone-binding protein n=1 Tax=Gregarina niphandrodes TaxID=110365 RepID=A0A023B1H4_GRENI|nr:putative histone-binding protein [Gregarina niphandrodes]EZG46946.1 putative histone-binding protein [Gregarina niphandrodes]|eukprot:XP_011132221.1 putative histone-binding protein [Gregarina niphandrodes]
MDERKSWQDNTGLLYEFLNNYSCEWPALSLEWLSTQPGSDSFPVAEFLLGTCADGPRENYVYLVDVTLGGPHGVSMENREYGVRSDRMGFEYGEGKPVYNIRKRIHIPLGEIHRARASRVEGSLLAGCVCASGESIVFDRSVPKDTEPIDAGLRIKEGDGHESVVARLCGHDSAAWGLAWSLFDGEQLLTSSDDHRICTWNLHKSPHDTSGGKSAWKAAKTITPVSTYSTGHTKAVQCVIPHIDHPAMFISAGDDGQICVWDGRISDHEHAFFPVVKDPTDAFNAVSQNKFKAHLLATGGTGTDVCIWDIRNCGYPLARLSHHDKGSNAVAFNEHRDYLLASAGAEGKVVVWDLRDIGKEQSAENAQDGPPELLFVHQGHTTAVQDICWAPDEEHEFHISSVSDNNEWQLWSYVRHMLCIKDTARRLHAVISCTHALYPCFVPLSCSLVV